MDTNRTFPPEWAEQSAVLVAWPEASGDFCRWFREVERTYTAIASSISRYETVIIACRDAVHERWIARCLTEQGAVPERLRWVWTPYDDIWVRDTAPLSVETPQGPCLLNFRFNGWGGKYPCDQDAALARHLYAAGVFGRTRFEDVDLVLEGGSVESDGRGTLLTTRRCLSNPNRNPSLSLVQIEQRLRALLGVHRVLWLHHGHAEGDDTDAHIDTLARFCAEDTIAYTACEDPGDAHYADLQAMKAELDQFVTPTGQPYRLVPLPIPRPVVTEDGARLPATYANFLVINGAVLVPVYGDPADEVALNRLATCFPGRDLAPIDCLPLIHQYGSLHCMTMQFPKSIPVACP